MGQKIHQKSAFLFSEIGSSLIKNIILCLAVFMVPVLAENPVPEQHSVRDKPWIILFLDIDGVLFRESVWDCIDDKKVAKIHELFGKLDSYYSFHWDCATAFFLNPTAVALLENFIDRTNLKYNTGIVLSSAWREGKTLEQIHQIFSPWRFSQFIIDKVVDGDGFYEYHQRPSIASLKKYGFPTHSRDEQIEYWLCEHTGMNIRQFIILDDDDLGLNQKFPNHFIHVRSGLLEPCDITTADNMLTGSDFCDTLSPRS